jgi:hypothetical protein
MKTPMLSQRRQTCAVNDWHASCSRLHVRHLNHKAACRIGTGKVLRAGMGRSDPKRDDLL